MADNILGDSEILVVANLPLLDFVKHQGQSEQKEPLYRAGPGRDEEEMGADDCVLNPWMLQQSLSRLPVGTAETVGADKSQKCRERSPTSRTASTIEC